MKSGVSSVKRIMEFLLDFASDFSRSNPGDRLALSQRDELPGLSRHLQGPGSTRHLVSEAISTSSFQDYLVRVVQRKLDDAYEFFPRSWTQYCSFESSPSLNLSLIHI